MVIEKTAVAGTLESSDAQVTVEPAADLALAIESSVLNQYGRQIKATVEETLGRLDARLDGAVEAAVFRSCDASASDIPWGGAVRS